LDYNSGTMSDHGRSSIETTLALLEALQQAREGLSASELQEQLGLSRSSLFALLTNLKALGYVQQAEKRGRYRAGTRLKLLGMQPAQSDAGLTGAFLAECANRHYCETVLLLSPMESGLLVTASHESQHALRISCSPGQTLAGSSAASMLFTLPTPADVIKNGYASDSRDGILTISLPVCRDGSAPDMAVQLMAPAVRWDLQDLLDQNLDNLRLTAAHLSYQLGAPAYHPYAGSEPGSTEQSTVMEAAEIDSFLSGPWTASLACIRPDGKPHVIPVWQEWDGEGFFILAFHGSQWADYVLQNPNTSLTVDEPWQPLRRVTARGTIELLSQLTSETNQQIIQRFQARYMGHASKSFAFKVSHVFRFTPDFLRGHRGITNR